MCCYSTREVLQDGSRRTETPHGRIETRTSHCNANSGQFLLPLPRAGGIELQFLQWSFPSRDSSTVIFTALEEYRLRGEWATPHTTLTHHLELVAGKKVVLSQGAVGAGCGVTADDARLLIVALQKFYGVGDGESGRRRRRLLELFSSGDDGFSAENLVGEVERID
jgi:ATP synthase F1 complex assembly factor 1